LRITYNELNIGEPFSDIGLGISDDSHRLDLSTLSKVSPELLLLGLKIKVANENASLGVLFSRMGNRVYTDMPIQDNGTVQLESLASTFNGFVNDIGVESGLLLVELLGYKSGLSRDLLGEGDGAEAYRGDWTGLFEYRLEGLLVCLKYMLSNINIIIWLCTYLDSCY
jgi:hypothetical protein